MNRVVIVLTNSSTITYDAQDVDFANGWLNLIRPVQISTTGTVPPLPDISNIYMLSIPNQQGIRAITVRDQL